MIDNTKEYILCAAVRRKERKECPRGGKPYKDGINDILDIELGFRHHDIYQRFFKELSTKPVDQGFYTSHGRYVNRKEGMKIAYEAGQMTEQGTIWTQQDIDKDWLKDENGQSIKLNVKPGEYKPLISKDLYYCSPDSNSINE